MWEPVLKLGTRSQRRRASILSRSTWHRSEGPSMNSRPLLGIRYSRVTLMGSPSGPPSLKAFSKWKTGRKAEMQPAFLATQSGVAQSKSPVGLHSVRLMKQICSVRITSLRTDRKLNWLKVPTPSLTWTDAAPRTRWPTWCEARTKL